MKRKKRLEPESDAKSVLSIAKVAVLSSVGRDKGRERERIRVEIKDGSDSQCFFFFFFELSDSQC